MVSLIHNNRFPLRQIVLWSFSICGASPKCSVASVFQPIDSAYMERSSTNSIADRILLESELRNWFAGQGVSGEGAAKAVQLLDATTLLAQPRPSRWNRRGAFGVQERCRYLWYRHAARILGWCERRRFPDTVTAILRTHVFPTQGERHEATREDGAGRITTEAHAGQTSIGSNPHCAGQSSRIFMRHGRIPKMYVLAGRLGLHCFCVG